MPNRQQRRAIARSGVTTRTFNYEYGKPGQVGHSKLDFSLRTDVKDELAGYVKLLEAALIDVKDELQK